MRVEKPSSHGTGQNRFYRVTSLCSVSATQKLLQPGPRGPPTAHTGADPDITYGTSFMDRHTRLTVVFTQMPQESVEAMCCTARGLGEDKAQTELWE